MGDPKRQCCEYCGADLGVFAHSRRLDGPLSCGSPECSREERNDMRAEQENAMLDAIDDNFGRYR